VKCSIPVWCLLYSHVCRCEEASEWSHLVHCIIWYKWVLSSQQTEHIQHIQEIQHKKQQYNTMQQYVMYNNLQQATKCKTYNMQHHTTICNNMQQYATTYNNMQQHTTICNNTQTTNYKLVYLSKEWTMKSLFLLKVCTRRLKSGARFTACWYNLFGQGEGNKERGAWTT
jgi:hypothetical protein